MKSNRLLLCIGIALIAGRPMWGQSTEQVFKGETKEPASKSDLTLHLGVSIPLGKFSRTVSNMVGPGSTGFVGGVKFTHHLTEFFDIGLLAVMSYNGFNTEKFSSRFGAGTSVSATHYMNTGIYALVGSSLSTTQNMKWYMQGNLGVVRSTSPEITIRSGGSEVTASSVSSFAFGYGAVVGFCVYPFDMSLRYSSAEPKYTYDTLTGQQVKTRQVISMLQIALGYIVSL